MRAPVATTPRGGWGAYETFLKDAHEMNDPDDEMFLESRDGCAGVRVADD